MHYHDNLKVYDHHDLKSFKKGIELKEIKFQNLNPDWEFLSFKQSFSSTSIHSVHPVDEKYA